MAQLTEKQQTSLETPEKNKGSLGKIEIQLPVRMCHPIFSSALLLLSKYFVARSAQQSLLHDDDDTSGTRAAKSPTFIHPSVLPYVSTIQPQRTPLFDIYIPLPHLLLPKTDRLLDRPRELLLQRVVALVRRQVEAVEARVGLGQLALLAGLLDREAAGPVGPLQVLEAVDGDARGAGRELQEARFLLCVPAADDLVGLGVSGTWGGGKSGEG